jgi:CHAT domain-containing protein
VLSACDTGRGEEVVGQGVLGLRSALMAAGSRAMVMSLWKVPADSTRKLMEAYYDHLWREHLSPAEALLAAQRALRDDPTGKFTAPLYWLAWVLVGQGW